MTDLRGVSVLIVDDDPRTVVALTAVLHQAEAFVAKAVDCEPARVFFRHRPPQVMLLDLTLPSCSGLELIEEARKARVQVVVVSGYVDAVVAKRALELGATVVLEKPIEVAELLDAVRKAVNAAA